MRRLTRTLVIVAAALIPPLIYGGVRFGAHRNAIRHPVPPALDPGLHLPRTVPYDSAKPTVAILLGSDISEITDAVGPYEMFARARAFNVFTVAAEARPTRLTGGLGVLPHLSLGGLDSLLRGKPPAIVVVPHIPNIDLPSNRPLVTWMQTWATSGALMFSWCTGAAALAESGVLDGRRATAHWGDIDRLEREYPKVRWQRGVRWVDEGPTVSSAGLTSGIDATLHVLDRVLGDSAARRVAAEMRYPNYHYALNPQVSQIKPRPADAVVFLNVAFRVARPRIGVGLYDGVGELELSNVYDAHAASGAAVVAGIGPDHGIVRTKHGMWLIPELGINAGDCNALRNLDRIVVTGGDAISGAASFIRELGDELPSIQPMLLQTNAARYSLEPVIEDLARSADRQTATFALRRLEYRSSTIDLNGAGIPWKVLVLPVALATIGLLLSILLTRSIARWRVTL